MSFSARKGNVTPIKDALDAWIKAMQLQEEYLDTYLLGHWEAIMGKTVAERTTRIYLKEDVLYLALDSATLRSQLFYAKTKLIEKLNQALGQNRITNIVFQ
jgi:predicted nucleic acid-binding Zn ribbon protein